MIRTVQNNLDIWLLDLLCRGLTRFTFDGASDTTPVWSPDGTRVLFSSNRKRAFDLYVGVANQPGVEGPLLESTATKAPQDWSSDGRFVLYYEVTPNAGRDLFAVDLTSRDRKVLPIASTPFEETPFPGPRGRWQVSIGGGVAPRWRADGKEIYFIAPDGSMMASGVTASGAVFDAASPVKLFPTRIMNGGSITEP
jgi:eukaryotic-like serine/threonine-protein kinase